MMLSAYKLSSVYMPLQLFINSHMKLSYWEVQEQPNQSTHQQQQNSSYMIRLNRESVIRAKEKEQELRALKSRQINSELLEINYDLSEGTCLFYIDKQFITRPNFIALRLYIKPLVGLFRDIELRPQIYFKIDGLNGNFEAPKIYNNIQLFHPNIDPQDCQIIIPEFVKDWNPVISYIRILQKLKYIILQPNPHCIPNNQVNKKAALFYKLHRNIYRQYCQDLAINYSSNVQNKMEIQGFYGDIIVNSHGYSQNEKQLIDIDYLFEPQQASKHFNEDDQHCNGIFEKKRRTLDDKSTGYEEQMARLQLQKDKIVKKLAIFKF